MQPSYLPALSAIGLELEIALLRSATLEPAPGADLVLQDACGGALPAVQMATTEWRRRPAASELTVAMLRPMPSLDGQAAALTASLRTLAGMLEPQGLRPSGAGNHPWVEAHRPVGTAAGRTDDPRARALDALTGPKIPDWADTRAAVLSFPFLDDEDFRPLLAALRLIVPILPALAAASPYRGGRRGATLDERIAAVQARAAALPALGGAWYPENTVGVHAYRDVVLEPLRSALAPLDPDGRLPIDDFNARAVVARFGPRIVQLRAADVQECPAQDVAIAAAVVELARALVRGDWLDLAAQMAVSDQTLADLGNRVLCEGRQASLTDAAALYGAPAGSSAGQAWSQLVARSDLTAESRAALEFILHEGTLAERMLRAVGDGPTPHDLRGLAETLADCLTTGSPFAP